MEDDSTENPYRAAIQTLEGSPPPEASEDPAVMVLRERLRDAREVVKFNLTRREESLIRIAQNNEFIADAKAAIVSIEAAIVKLTG